MDRMAVPLVVAKVFPVGKPSPNNHNSPRSSPPISNRHKLVVEVEVAPNHPRSGPAISNRRKLVVAARDLV